MLPLRFRPGSRTSRAACTLAFALSLSACGGNAQTRSYLAGPFRGETPAGLFHRAMLAVQTAGYYARGDAQSGRIEALAHVSTATFVVQCYAEGFVGVTIAQYGVEHGPKGSIRLPEALRDEYEHFVFRLHEAGIAPPRPLAEPTEGE